MKCLLVIFVFLGLQAAAQPLIIGEQRKLQSVHLGEERQLNIYLPQPFDTTQRYSVLYLLDGSMHEDFLHVVGLCQFFNLMYTMPPTIVVGIENVDRKRDFTYPTRVPEQLEKTPTSGHSDRFMAFLETELRPFIDKNYPTSGERMLLGQSLGGLLATEILLKRPQLFTHYFIVSPSLWWDNQSLLEQASELPTKPEYVFIGVGKKEPLVMRQVAKKLHKLLKNKGLDNLYFKKMAEEDHATILHNCMYAAFLTRYKSRY